MNESKHEDRRDDNRLAEAVELHARVLYSLVKRNNNNAILDRMEEMERKILMKLSEVKTEVAAAAADSAEAFAELGTRIADLDAQIAALVAAATDPEITDEVFLTNLTALRASSQALKDIVPNVVPPVEPTP